MAAELSILNFRSAGCNRAPGTPCPKNGGEREMSYTVGDGSVVLALAAGVVGYLYVKHGNDIWTSRIDCGHVMGTVRNPHNDYARCQVDIPKSEVSYATSVIPTGLPAGTEVQ
jgi:hypothetical protein